MTQTLPGYRTDQQLEAMFYETGNWVVNGHRQRVLCAAMSLRCAIERATAYTEAKESVLAVSRLPHEDIILFPRQIARIAQLTREHDCYQMEEPRRLLNT